MPGANPGIPEGSEKTPRTLANLLPGQAGTEQELCESALCWLFKWMLSRQGGGQLILEAHTATTGKLKTPPEARRMEQEVSWEHAGQAVAPEAGCGGLEDTAPQQRRGSTVGH